MSVQDLERRNKKLEKRWKVLAVLAILFLVTRPIALYVYNKALHKNDVSAFANKYPMLDPARQFTPEEDYVTNVQSLRDYMAQLKRDPANGLTDDNFSIYYEQLNSGANISVNKDVAFYPASLSKLAL